MKKHPRIGITGGIGSGKTTICRMFEVLGIPVYDADERAKFLIVNDPEIKAGIIDILGPEAYLPDGSYNRTFVGGIVFKDKDKLLAINQLVHPAVEKDGSAWHEAQIKKGAPYTLKEAALMIESGSYKHLDQLIVVTAPEALRIQRVVARDGSSPEQVQARIRNQLPEAEKCQYAHYIIENDGHKMLVPQVWNIHQKILSTYF
jgi:dephospho-CoA kinase